MITLRPLAGLLVGVLWYFTVLTGAHGAAWNEVQPLMERYCLDCHGGSSVKGDLDIAPLLKQEAAWHEDVKLLEHMDFLIAENEMPPPTAKEFPTAAERKSMLRWVLDTLDAMAADAPDDPGYVVMPRLTRDTYNKSLSDLSGEQITPGDVLPVEAPTGEGFTNVGENQTMEPNQFEKYLRAASNAMTYARITPVVLEWDNLPYTDVDAPWRQREEKLVEFQKWFTDNFNRITNAPEDWYKDDGVGHATYWYYAWAWKHRDTLGLNINEPGEVVPPDEKRDVNPVILANWVRFFETESNNTAITELQKRWNQTPGPRDLKPQQVREQFGQLESWFRLFTDYLNEEPDIELDARRIYGAPQESAWKDEGKHVYRHDFSKYKGEDPVTQLALIVSTSMTPSQDDVVVWRNGRFLYGKDLEKKDPGPQKPWHQVPGVQITDDQGQPVAWGSHPDGDQIPADAIAVRAPSILTLTVPADATGLELEVFLDYQKHPDVLVQTWVSPKLPEGPDGNIADWITRRRPIGSEQANRKFRGMSSAWRDALYDWGKYDIRTDGDYIWVNTTSIQPYYSEVKRPYEPKETPHSPYRLKPAEFFEAVGEEQLAKWEVLIKELDALAQKPHQDLLALTKEHGLELFEGQLPSAEQISSLPGEASQRARDLAHAVVQEELQLREFASHQVGEFTTRAWRRPPSTEELEDLLSLYTSARENGMSYDAAVKQALRGTLVSVHFLYRYQRSQNSEEPYPISARGLADRLAFVLWGSIPDEPLLQRVADDSILQDDVLTAEVRRMLADDRSQRLAVLFAGEWLGYKDFGSHNDPDPDRYKQYHEQDIAPAMEQEAVLFLNDILRGQAPATALYQADYTYLNEDLAGFYGIDGVKGDKFRRVELPENRRGGALTLGAFLTKKSMPLRTSAVKRGAWIIENILGEHLPDPPPDVPDLSADETNEAGLTVAQQLAKHRDDPACMGCHQRIDPLGIALENFDPVGQWRSEFLDGTPVGASDTAADGTQIDGLPGLTAFIDQHREDVIYNFCRMFAGYALGRSIQPSDRAMIEEMRDAVIANNNQFPTAIEVFVKSKQFRYRRDEV